MSTGLGDKLYSTHNIVSLDPRRFPILSSNTKPIIGHLGDIVIILPNVLKFGLNVNG